ncbi:outer membrane protein [Roseomonas sp. HF4]|uniref:outer membrane protein n=1 Tax=Roseomonas sp. HF4 TaxID=2562313 RepID=UPI0010C0FB36|nr:transporter [Roseomonas sp. HF4]
MSGKTKAGYVALALLAGAIPSGGAFAQGVSAEELRAFRAALERQQQQLREQSDRLARQERLIQAQSREIETLRGAVGAPPSRRTAAAQRAPAAAPVVVPAPAGTQPAEAPRGPSTAAEAAQVARREEQRVLGTDPTLARVGGVLTPRGALSVEPTLEYLYGENIQATVNGFSIVPGITFGSVDIRRSTRRAATAAVTLRYGVTDRFEINTRIPYVFRNDTIETGPSDITAQPIVIDPSGDGLGDIEFGASYQINAGLADWPIFIANLRVKSDTGRSPFEVPIYTVNDIQGGFLRGLERELPTGTGFWSVEPGITVAWASDPAVFFGGLRYIWNIARDVDVQDPAGGPSRRLNLDPGDGIGLNFGVGFALNERTSISLGYEHIFVFRSSQEGQSIAGSSTDIGTFNFGLSYRASEAVSVNLGVGIGVTEGAPDARLILRVPVRFNLI